MAPYTEDSKMFHEKTNVYLQRKKKKEHKETFRKKVKLGKATLGSFKTFGNFWELLSIFGYFWVYLGLFGYFRSFGVFWVNLGSFWYF